MNITFLFVSFLLASPAFRLGAIPVIPHSFDVPVKLYNGLVSHFQRLDGLVNSLSIDNFESMIPEITELQQKLKSLIPQKPSIGTMILRVDFDRQLLQLKTKGLTELERLQKDHAMQMYDDFLELERKYESTEGWTIIYPANPQATANIADILEILNKERLEIISAKIKAKRDLGKSNTLGEIINHEQKIEKLRKYLELNRLIKKLEEEHPKVDNKGFTDVPLNDGKSHQLLKEDDGFTLI